MGAAAGTVAATDVILKDNWPVTLADPHIPTSGFTGADQYNVSSLPSGKALGQKVTYYDATSGGWVTMIYLKVVDAGDSAIAAGTWLRPAGATDNSGEKLYYVSNDTDDDMYGSGKGPSAVAIGAATDGYFVWAWCGGPPPQDGKTFCSAIAEASLATYLDAGNSAAGPFAVGDAGAGDAGAAIEIVAGMDIAGYINSASGATAT
jgi:hypothetical protein